MDMFSKLVPSGGGPAAYRDVPSAGSDVNMLGQPGPLDANNLSQEDHDFDLADVEGVGSNNSSATPYRRAEMPSGRARQARDASETPEEDLDNEVPVSLLAERHGVAMSTTTKPRGRSDQNGPTYLSAADGAQAARSRDGWQDTRRQRSAPMGPNLPSQGSGGHPLSLMHAWIPKSRKLVTQWRWANVSNLDNFIQDVYDYYQGCGIWCILLERAIHLGNVAFVAAFMTFLSQCIDYSKIRGSTRLSQVLVAQCTRKMSGLWNLGLWFFAFYFVWKTIQYLLDIRRLVAVRDFYHELLNIPDHDMQTVTWQDVVARIMALRDQNTKTATSLTPAQRHYLGSQSKERLDASDIANRLMRRENYLIALFNKDVLDLTVPFPLLQKRQFLSRTLEWTLGFSILDFVFDDQGQVSQDFLRSDRRAELSMQLRRRFVFAGTMILMMSPFLAGYLIIVYFLTYYNQYQRNPSAIGSRTYTPLAEWKFREFNELPHLFKDRLNMSHPFATHYIDQFPKVKTEMIAKAVAFIAGSLATVLAIVSLLDSDMSLSFEITPDRTVLFYLGILGSVWAVAHGTVSEENAVFDPEYALRNVIEYTHYQPDHWRGRLHSYEVKREFSELYKVKLVIFVEEILSILTTPFVLYMSLPKCSDRIVDFFREFTIHVDGLGYVCSFAEFDFKKGVRTGKRPVGDRADVRDDYYETKHGKMEISYYNFMGNYGNYALDAPAGAPHLRPGAGHPFHPPPAWPSTSSPGAAAEISASRAGRCDRTRLPKAVRTPRFQAPPLAHSPMASILLDPHHQPVTANPTRRHPARGTVNQSRVIAESMEEEEEEEEHGESHRSADDDAPDDNGGALNESTWPTTPSRGSREGRKADRREGPESGVVQMIYQFNQAQLNRHPGRSTR